MIPKGTAARCAALALLALCVLTPFAYGLVRSPADVRLPYLGFDRGFFAAGPGRVLAGGEAVYTTPDQIFGWSLTTGRYEWRYYPKERDAVSGQEDETRRRETVPKHRSYSFAGP